MMESILAYPQSGRPKDGGAFAADLGLWLDIARSEEENTPPLPDPPKKATNNQEPDGTRHSISIATKAKPKPKKPSMYRVLLLNDDYTPMEFVIYVLERFFNKSREEATSVMLHVHQKGVGVCGVFTYEIAETKVAQVLDLARRNEHPLACTMEKD